MSSRRFLFCIVVLVFGATSASAKVWRGIEPLHSSRADVERLLGPPNYQGTRYDFPEETGSIEYAVDGCKEGLPGGWNVPKDIVIKIEIYLKSPRETNDVLIPGKEYEEIYGSDLPGYKEYIDNEEGIRFFSDNGVVHHLEYIPAAKDKGLSCGDYKYAAPVRAGVKLKRVERLTWDQFGDKPFEEAKGRLDNFVIQLFNLDKKDSQWHGYIVVYAGSRAYAGEAQFKADCYRNYLVRFRGMDPAKLFAANGGFREEPYVELYLQPADFYPPLMEPTVSPKKVKIINRRLRNCSQRSPSQQLP